MLIKNILCAVPSLVWLLSCGEARGQNCEFLVVRHSISGMDLASSIKCGNHLGKKAKGELPVRVVCVEQA